MGTGPIAGQRIRVALLQRIRPWQEGEAVPRPTKVLRNQSTYARIVMAAGRPFPPPRARPVSWA